MKLALAQFNPRVGDIEGNATRMIEIAQQTAGQGADVLVFPELALCGYPPEDLLLRPSMDKRVARELQRIAAAAQDTAILVGYPAVRDGQRRNICGCFYRGECLHEYAKSELPNYRVFDEKRYFEPGEDVGLFEFRGERIGLLICEDLWQAGPVQRLSKHNPDLVLVLNASPFHGEKHPDRLNMLKKQQAHLGCPVIYLNAVGGQDELVFDGDSMALNRAGDLICQAAWFYPCQFMLEFAGGELAPVGDAKPDLAVPEPMQALYEALKLGLRDYVDKNGFPGVVLGLSGGIDSALTLAIAVDALGADRVEAIMMPFRYTSDLSQSAAAMQAQWLGVSYRSISIEPGYDTIYASLADEFSGFKTDITEQNIQARLRGVLLMAISNKKGSLVITTGNKSEVAVGYSTLYGDMAGGYNVLKDVFKTDVYRLSRWRNQLSLAIPPEVIERPPSAELAPDQKDEDSLPGYDLLDRMLRLYIEQDLSAEEIVQQGFDAETVYRVVKLVDRNEYKRRQAPVGTRVSRRGFGRDRRYPITNGWAPGD